MLTRKTNLVLIGAEGRAGESATLFLVAALIALDCHPFPHSPLVEIIEDVSESAAEDAEPVLRTRHEWHFDALGADRRTQTDLLRKGWHSAQFLLANPAHPLTRIRLAFHSAGALQILGEVGRWDDGTAGELQELRDRAAALGDPPACWLDNVSRNKHRASDPLWSAVGDAFTVLELLKVEVAKNVPRMLVRKGQKSALIPLDATEEQAAKLLERIDK